MKTAVEPFAFITASYVTRIGNQIAPNLGALVTGLEECSDLSIFLPIAIEIGPREAAHDKNNRNAGF